MVRNFPTMAQFRSFVERRFFTEDRIGVTFWLSAAIGLATVAPAPSDFFLTSARARHVP